MNKLNQTQQQLLEDYARFIRGQNSKVAHTTLRVIGGAVILGALIFQSFFGIAIGLLIVIVSFLGKGQLKYVDAALNAADKPHVVKTIKVDIQTELWENNVSFIALADSDASTRHKIRFVSIGKAPEKGAQFGTAYFLEGATYPALISLENTLIIPSKPPVSVRV